MRSPIWRTTISRSTFSRRAKNSPSVMMVPRRRYGSRYSRESLRPRSRSRRLRVPRSERSRAGRSVFSRTSRTLTTVTTPSSSMTSPGVTPSPVARRRRRRRCVVPSAFSEPSSEVSSESFSEFSCASAPSPFGLRRPRPPRRRRRLRFPRPSASSDSAAGVETSSASAGFISFFAAVLLARFGATASAGAA